MKEQSAEFERWEKYRLANSKFPQVRQIELQELLKLTNPIIGEHILEIGTGNGYLTFELAKAVGNQGEIITFDYQKSNLDFVERKNQGRYPITTIHQDLDYNFDIPKESVSKVSSIATLHHYDDRSLNTGTTGRKKALQEFHRVLKQGGEISIADVAQGTVSQKYFDAIDDPKHCSPRGHPHDFLDEGLARKLCEEVGFSDIEFEVKIVPWVFESEEQAKEFIHTVHNAKCSPEESLKVAKQYLPFEEVDGKVRIAWELFYLKAKKIV